MTNVLSLNLTEAFEKKEWASLMSDTVTMEEDYK